MNPFLFCIYCLQRKFLVLAEGEVEGEVAFFSAKRWDHRNRADLIESATPCHDAQVVGPHPTILAAMSEDYTTAPQHLHKLSMYVQLCSHTVFE